jgi:hypothetical protein
MLPTLAHTQTPPSLKPGGYFNPWVIRQNSDGTGTIQSKQFTGGDPLKPGSIFNPYIIERHGNEIQIKPQFPYEEEQSNETDND